MPIWNRTAEVDGVGECIKATDMPMFLYQTETNQVGPQNRAGLMAFKARAKELLVGRPLSIDGLAETLAKLVGGEQYDPALREAFVRAFGSPEAGAAFLNGLQWGLGGPPPR